MKHIFTTLEQANADSISIVAVTAKSYSKWLESQTDALKNQLEASQFEARSGKYFLSFNAEGDLHSVILGMKDENDFWAFGVLSSVLPEGDYRITTDLSPEILHLSYMAWGLGSYVFDRYKSAPKKSAKLVLDQEGAAENVSNMVETTFWVRDLINTPTKDLGPEQLAAEAEYMGQEFGAKTSQIVGEALKKDYPCVHAVGRGSDREPRLFDLRWGNPEHPKLTLVGKGVCFDSGGYDIKPSSGMLHMKKDMGGAAHTLGLARLIMAAKLPVCLRVMVPMVENLISGRSYLPGEILTSRSGKTIEVTNTDAEGRLILLDALDEASSENPDLLIDFATLTGAARIAVGPELSVFFANDKKISKNLMECSEIAGDPLWELPLFQSYKASLKSHIADMCNAVLDGRGGGAITAALFLENFVKEGVPWVHFDLLAQNYDTKPGRPKGGEAMSLRAAFAFVKSRYG